MHNLSSKQAKNIQELLASKGFSYNVVELASSTRTANEAAKTIGCEVAQIIKSLLFRSEETDQPILLLVSGVNRVNEKKIETLIGEKIVKADADFTRLVTGFAIGGIPPVGHKQAIKHIFIDEDLLQYDILWAAAGTPNAVFSLDSKHLQQITDGKIVSVV